MKKVFILILFVLCNLALTSCSMGSNVFHDKELWIKFNYSSEQYNGNLETEGTKVIYKDPNSANVDYIEIFKKDSNQKTEELLLNTVASEWKNPEDCKVIDKWVFWANPEYHEYAIDLAKPFVTYSLEDLMEIKNAELESKKTGSPFNWEWKKKIFFNNKRIRLCSSYADQLIEWPIESTPSRFIYNNKDKILFLPAISWTWFYIENSIELFE